MNTAYRMALICSAALPILSAAPACAQHMPGMHMSKPMRAPPPATPPGTPPATNATPAPEPAPAPAPSPAHDHGDMAMDMPGMEHGGMDHGAMGHVDPDSPAEGSGTSRLPANGGGHHGLHLAAGDWQIMVHGFVSTQYTSDTGPRGDRKFYALSHLMVTASHETGWGRLQLRGIGSLEPLMRADGFPSLFTTGEVAFGQPLVDRQHPHDLIAELSAKVEVDLGTDTRGFVYGGPAAEPALGPTVYLHRPSAKYNPEPPITHHWFDSTHLSFGVITAGLANRHFQLETSAFRGQEPDEHRFDIEAVRLDSWSVRATWNPSPEFALQASTGFLKQPEAAHSGENEQRTTVSVHYANHDGLSAMVGYAVKHRLPGPALDAFLAEANWDIDRHNSFFGRIENVNNDELFSDPASAFHDREFRVTKFQAGYARRYQIGPIELAAGGSVSAFAKPALLDTAYGRHPMGYTGFVRLSLGH